MGSRLFVGLPIAPELVARLAAWKVGREGWPVYWVWPQDLHVTLVPPWEEAAVDKVVLKLNAVKAESFGLKFTQISFGPQNAKPARLLWVSGAETSGLFELRARLFTALGQQPDARPFLPHVTLARFRPQNYLQIPDAGLPQKVAWQIQAEKFGLYESVLNRTGARYRILREFPLQPSLRP
ncbi:MAG: RNA 2',3'-cyclic phosphodiesterase [Patescibacteria group bacterium]|nr:RNA 2',3'-cyclic phosphodiesterase [Patescibacteria group bacterium]